MAGKDPIVAVGFFTQRELDVLGQGLTRVYRVEETDMFDDLLAAIDHADEAMRRQERRHDARR